MLTTGNELREQEEPSLLTSLVKGVFATAALVLNPQAVFGLFAANSVVTLVKTFWEISGKFVMSVAAFLEWLEEYWNYWTKSYHDLARDAKMRLQDLDAQIKQLVKAQEYIERQCLDPQGAEERKLCMKQGMDGAKTIYEARLERSVARQKYSKYVDKHNYWNPGNRIEF